MGRKSKHTPARQEAVLQSLRNGNTRRTAAAQAGIDHATFYRWMEKATFRDAVEAAEAQAEQAHVAVVATAALKGKWQASAWWLERRRHKDWQRHTMIGGDPEAPVQVQIPQMSTAELLAKLPEAVEVLKRDGGRDL